ncbi:MAG: AbrB/MazE/SpoVT family DNA-binding domain-containing protein [Deltaproteobacteria bacterium]|nr:AbrB/MazE/SpoVT family DNA-binding domain-containing protein [Deltaproteobacteria bacterium]
MTYTSLSTKYQVVIPKEVRERIDIKPGQKFIIWEKGGVIYLIPDINIKSMEGFLKGMDANNVRDRNDRT